VPVGYLAKSGFHRPTISSRTSLAIGDAAGDDASGNAMLRSAVMNIAAGTDGAAVGRTRLSSRANSSASAIGLELAGHYGHTESQIGINPRVADDQSLTH
jgi:hypothetical protein